MNHSGTPRRTRESGHSATGTHNPFGEVHGELYAGNRRTYSSYGEGLETDQQLRWHRASPSPDKRCFSSWRGLCSRR